MKQNIFECHGTCSKFINYELDDEGRVPVSYTHLTLPTILLV